MADYKIELGVTLDTDDLHTQLGDINKKVDPIKLDIDLNHVKQQINEIKSQIKNLDGIKIQVDLGAGSGSRGGAKSAVNDLDWAYKQMLDIQKKANSLKIKMAGLDTSKNVGELKELSTQFARLRSDYETLKRTFGSQLSATQFGNLQAEIDETADKLEIIKRRYADTRAELAKSIKTRFNDGEFNVMPKLTKDVNQLASTYPKLTAGLNEVKSALKEVEVASGTEAEVADVEKLIAAHDRLEHAIKNVKNLTSQYKAAEKNDGLSDSLATAKEAALLKLQGLFNEGSEAAKKYGARAKELEQNLNRCGNIDGVREVNRQIANLGREISNTNTKTKTFGQEIKEQWEHYKSYLSVASLISYGTQALRDMFEQVKLIDSAMTELKKVTNETDATYNEFLTNAADRAKVIGTTIDGLVSSTADFARLGYGFEDAQGLAEVANIYAVVGDEIEGVEGATESLISTMSAFKGEMNGMSNTDFAMSIIDKFNEIGNNFAISSGGIGEALERSASSLMAANNTIDESIALITAANTVVQDPAQVGQAFKTISMRIRGAKTELEEAGLETDGMVESTAKLRSEIMALTGVDIMDGANQFKSTYAIMDELAAKWQDLSDIQQATVTELIAGKRQGNIVSSLMTNFDTARDALETSLNSAGSAMAEHEKWQQSLEARINSLKASWQALSQTFLSSDFLKGTIDSVIKLVDALEWLIDNFGLLGTISLGVIGKNIFSYFKGAKEAKTTLNDVVNAINGVNSAAANGAESIANMTNANTEMVEAAMNATSATTEATEAMANTTSAMTEGAEAASNMASATTEGAEALSNTTSIASETAETVTNVASASSEATESIANMTSTTTEANEALMNTVSAGTEASETVGNLASGASEFVEAAGNTASVATESAETITNLGSATVEAGKGAVKGAGGFKAFFSTLGGKIAIAAAVIGVISLIVNQVKKAKEEASRLRREAIEVSDEFLDASNSFEKAYIKYSGKTNLTVEEEAELESAIKGTVDALDNKSSALQNAVNSSNDYVTSLERITRAELDAAKTAAREKRDQAELELKEIAGDDFIGDSKVRVSLGGREASIIRDIAGEFYQTESRFAFPQQSSDGTWSTTYETMWLTLPDNADINTIVNYYHTLLDCQEALSNEGLIDSSVYEGISAQIEKMSGAVDTYTSGVYDAIKAEYQWSNGIPKTTEEYLKMREAILGSEDIKGLSLGAKNIIANTLDSTYKSVFDLSSAEVQARKFIGLIEGYGDGTKDGTDEIGTVETFLNMRTAVNNNECSVGEYLSQFNEIDKMTESWSSEEKELLNTSFGLDTDTIKQQYDEMSTYLLRLFKPQTPEPKAKDGDTLYRYSQQLSAEKERAQLNIEEFLKSLTADELAAVIDIRTEIDWANTSAEDIRKQIEDQAAFIRAMDFTIAIDVEAEGIEAFNTAMSESVSGAGLSSDSIKALKSRYSELASQGYDLSAMFEETSNGIHINRKAVSEFEKILASKKLSETQDNLGVLKDRYDELTDKIKNCTDAGERADLYNDQQEVARKINDLATLASQYEGLTSAYQEWQNVESSGSERDMYEQVIEGFENIGDEISRGWYDDGTIKFLELMTGKTDLAGKSASELKKIWKGLDNNIKNTSYSVKDFFTTDDDGNSTSTGVYNFLRALQELESSDTVSSVLDKQFKDIENIKDLVTVKDGKITAFNFDVVGGDEAIAEALGISEELVQIMLRAADDAGFVVTLDGNYTQLADLKTSAEEANDTLKKFKSEGLDKLKDTDLNFDFSANNLEDLNTQLEKATNVLDKFRNKDGTINTKVDGAEEALEIASYFTATLDKLTEPVYMQIETNEVEKELQEPLEKMQEFERWVKKKHQFELEGDTEGLKEAEAEMNKIVDYIYENNDLKARLEIEGLSKEEIKAKLEKGEIEIPATVDIQLEMSDDIKDMRLMMMRQLGLISDEQLKLELQYDVDYSAVEDYKPETQKAVVEFFETHEEVDKYTPEDKKALVRLIAKKENPDDWKVEDIDAFVKYYADDEQIKDWSPEEKKAYAKYLVDGGEVDGWSPEAKDAFVKYLVDGGDPDKFDPDDKESWVVYKKDSTIPDGYRPNDPNAKVIYAVNSSQVDSYNPPNYDRFVTYYVKKAFTNGAKAGKKVLEDRFGFVDGTAFKQGSWGTKNSGTALVGELGREVLVREGKYYTIGDNGAEFIKYKKGDIIFNHVQSEELFKNGRVTSGGGRAKALVNGTAFMQGTAFSGGSDGGEEPDSGSSGNDKFEDTIDWIETILDRAERAIDKYEKQANNVYKTWNKRNKALEDEISEVTNTRSLYEQAKKQYESEFNSIGLEQKYVDRIKGIKDGLISDSDIIQDFAGSSDEKIVEKIKNYQDLYEKYLDCIDKIDELKEKEASLYSERFKNVQTEYENLLQGFEHTQSMLDKYINQAEAKGHVISKNYYNSLIANENDRIKVLKQEQAALIQARDEAVANNEFDKYSQDWYDMCAEIDSVTQSIEEGETALIEYNNAIRDIDFEVFELIQERISDITAEADFLIELMSHKDLFDDKGKLTEQGQATIGLHGQNYNTYMYQADDYGAKVAEIDKKIASGELDGYSYDVINKRKEYLELQRECILNAENEKDAIRDLIEEGIDLELDSLGELIDKYQDALQSQKDLYDYQKRVEEQTKNISSLQKQLAAYEGDNSEEAKAKIQELRVSLQEAEDDLAETEFEHYINQQEQLLTSLFDEYELMLSERIDNLDYLITQQIEAVNANALDISETLSTEADAVGYTLSEEMKNIWTSEQTILTTYTEKFDTAATAINTVLGDIKTGVNNMVKALDKDAKNDIKDPGTKPSSIEDPVKTPNNGNKPADNGDKDPKREINNDTLMGIAAAIWNYQKENYGGWGANPDRKKKLTDKLGAENAAKVQQYINSYGATGKLYNFWISKGKNLSAYKYSAFKLGAKDIDETQLAWTQENGREYIVRPSDGAILTPVAKGDSVLTSAATNNIWNMANSPAEFIKDNLNLGSTNVPNNSSVQNSYVQNLDKVVFSFPNVKNYDEMLAQMQRDPNFERLVEAMSIGRLAGKSSLAKGKAIR